MYTSGGTLVCEAFSKVEVGIPSMMTLNLQSEYLCVGCQMPVFPAFPKVSSCVFSEFYFCVYVANYCLLYQGDLFSFYEVCKDYSWSVDDEKVEENFLFHCLSLKYTTKCYSILIFLIG